jgi:hypothetical protein
LSEAAGNRALFALRCPSDFSANQRTLCIERLQQFRKVRAGAARTSDFAE